MNSKSLPNIKIKWMTLNLLIKGLLLVEVNVKELDGACVKQPNNKLLPFHAYSNKTHNTPTMCIQECHDKAFNLAGVKWSKECWCGNEDPPRSKYTAMTLCNMPCTGDKTIMCGGGDVLNMYKTSKLMVLKT